MSPLRVLHVFSTFAPGGPQVRTVDLMHCLGPSFTHVVAAMDGVTTAAARISGEVQFKLIEAPPAGGTVSRALAARHLLLKTRPELVITYNWGAIEAAMGARLGTGIPLLHAEDGFGADESSGLKPRRVWTRRLVLRGAAGVVVPSRTLERIALEQYRLPRDKVIYIANGVDTERFAPRAGGAAKQALGIDEAVPVIGTVGHLRPEKNLVLLVEAFARLERKDARLLIAGGGPCGLELQAAAGRLGCAGRVVFTGMLADTTAVYEAMDVFALSSDTEQMPVALLEAMASGLPAVCTDVGDCAAMLEAGAPPFIVPAGDAGALAAALDCLLGDAALRSRAGEANRRRAVTAYSRAEMIARYRRLYLETAGRKTAGEDLQ